MVEKGISVLEGYPVLVHLEPFLNWAQVGSLNGDGPQTAFFSRTYLDDKGRPKVYDVSVRFSVFRDQFILIHEIFATSSSGYRKYGWKWRREILNELREMKTESGVRSFREGDRVRVLVSVGVDGNPDEHRYVDIILAKREDVTSLIETTDGDWWFEYNGKVYSRHHLGYRFGEAKDVLSLVELLTATPLNAGETLYWKNWVVIDGVPYYELCARKDLAFYVQPGTLRSRVEIGSGYVQRGYCQTWHEVLARLADAGDFEVIKAKYKILCPELLGEPLPTYEVGDRVVVHITDPNDRRIGLNGLSGRVTDRHVSGGYVVCFFNYWSEVFFPSELRPATDENVQELAEAS